MTATDVTWIPLPPDRRGAKCPVSGFCRRKMQQLIYGIPSRGIRAQVAYKHVPGPTPDAKGKILVNVPSLMRHLTGEPELTPEIMDRLTVLAQSPDWCRSAMNTALRLCNDRAGLTAAQLLTYLSHEH
jgi:hypothetical protein